MHIKDIMSHPLVTAPTNATLSDAARLMWEFDCGIVPITDGEGRLAGVVTDRDICMAAYTQGRPLGDICVTTAMASGVIACHIDDGLELAEWLMRDNQIRRVPVLDAEQRPVGIVSMSDIARIAATSPKSATEHGVLQTLAAVCAPRADIAHAHANNVIPSV